MRKTNLMNFGISIFILEDYSTFGNQRNLKEIVELLNPPLPSGILF